MTITLHLVGARRWENPSCSGHLHSDFLSEPSVQRVGLRVVSLQEFAADSSLFIPTVGYELAVANSTGRTGAESPEDDLLRTTVCELLRETPKHICMEASSTNDVL